MIYVERRGPVLLVTLDRQDRRNALDHDALDELHRVFRDLGDARAVVVTGAGDHFCAGADLKGVEDESFRDRLRIVLADLRTVPIPTIAAVHGAALGAGTQVAIACDLRVATPDARFGIPAGRLGLMVDQWTVQRVAMLCGQGTASSMLLAAEVVSGEDANKIGLVQRLGGLDHALDWASEITTLAPLTIAGHKLALNRLERDVDDDVEFRQAFSHAWGSEDFQEGLAAFREGRDPDFKGR